MIIKSLLDTDLYKLTMMQYVFHQFSNADVKYAFKCRNKGISFASCDEHIKKEIKDFCNLSFTEEELQYLLTLGLFKQDFIDFLRTFKLNYKDISVKLQDNGELSIRISGKWLNTILFEVPVLAIVNECYFYDYASSKNEWEKIGEVFEKNLEDKINLIKNGDYSDFFFVDFGTRRRFSYIIHEKMISKLVRELPKNLVGTSNVHFARKYGISPKGTSAHEKDQACQALTRIQDSLKFSLQTWQDEYRGKLGIALSDILGIDVFLKEFDLYFAKLYDGIRQDSGDPFVVANKVISHYQKLGINPKTKALMFSDGLTVPKALELYKTFNQMINCSFGIGTSLTNDVGLEPLQVVIKMTECNGQPVCKISDSSGKEMCESQAYVDYVKSIFGIGK